MNSNVFDFYFLIWSLSRLLCCVGSVFSVAVVLGGGTSRPRYGEDDNILEESIIKMWTGQNFTIGGGG
jgi:hypothetical protein